MASNYTTRMLYGGAMSVELPQDYIDSSDLRQIPDHQEVFLSSSKLTSIIFEINEYVYQSDENAVKYHFTDVISSPDKLSAPLNQPERIKMANSSLSGFSAYIITGDITSQEVIKPIKSALPVEWQQRPETQNVITRVHQLVIRLEDPYHTDLCVRINIPMKELPTEDEQNKENATGLEMMEKIVQTLSINDFDLFGA